MIIAYGIRLILAAAVSGIGGVLFAGAFGLCAWAVFWLPVAVLLGIWAAASRAFEGNGA